MIRSDPILVVAERIAEGLRRKIHLAPKLKEISIDRETRTVVFTGRNGAAVEMDVQRFVDLFATAP